MKNKIPKILIIAAFLVMGVVYLYNINKTKSKVGLNEQCRQENILLKEGFFQSFLFEAVHVDFEVHIHDYKNEETCLKDIVGNSYAMIMFAAPKACSQCSMDNIEKVKKLHTEGRKVALFLAGFEEREFKSFVANNDLSDFAYRIDSNYFSGFSVNPTVFAVAENYSLKHVYAPSEIFPGLTEDYFNNISTYY